MSDKILSQTKKTYQGPLTVEKDLATLSSRARACQEKIHVFRFGVLFDTSSMGDTSRSGTSCRVARKKLFGFSC